MQFSEKFLLMEKYILELQSNICNAIEEIDGKNFITDEWEREEGGGGKSRVIENGNIFEKGGVNISSVHGKMSEAVSKQLNTEVQQFGACGISLILHPFSPKIPTIHLNVRYFETENGKNWFGGGIDLTPYYPYIEDFKYFHNTLKNACEIVIPGSYKDYKKQCDEYFTVQHRNEMRGIGGIFFDYLTDEGDIYFNLVKSVGNSFLNSYLPIVEKRKNEKFSAEEKEFQLIRRGRYVEFNLIYDRGTLFGLKTGGRIESILISMPPEVKFKYNWTPVNDTKFSEMWSFYQPRHWADE